MPATARVDAQKLAALLLLSPAWAAVAQETSPAPAAAGTAPAAAPTEELLRELDEVVVRGERLQETIVRAEDEFFKLYNSVNKDDQYDVNCPFVNLTSDRGSRINSRVCLPVFVAESVADWTVFKINCEPEFVNFDGNKDGRITRIEAAMNPDLDFQFDDLDQNDDGYLSEHGEFDAFENWALVNLNCFRPSPPELVLLEKTDDWYRQMMAVTKADPRLQDMSGRLDELHRERDLLNRALLQFEATDEPREVPAMSTSGPRGR
jgi:hypothetical protein